QGFGTGLLKVTPAHDANDFDIARRVWPNAEMPLIMEEDGTMGDARRHDGTSARSDRADRAGVQTGRRVPQEFEGLDRFEARKRIVKQLEREGLLVKTEPHRHSVRRCYRCDTVVEPRLSDQWFVKMKPLAEPVLAQFREGAYKIVPERWRATYDHWMESIRDWNISRQIWWGHRIPVFTCTKCEHQWAARTDPEQCPRCAGPASTIEQDPNDLETTFAPGRDFANKLWNIGQFVLGQLTPQVPALESVDRRSLTLADRWILSRAQAVIREASASLEQFRLDEAAKRCFEFAW